MGFTPYWDYKPIIAIHADSQDVYTSGKIFNLSAINKIRLKCDVIIGSVVNRKLIPIMFSFILDKLPGCRDFSEPETIQ